MFAWYHFFYLLTFHLSMSAFFGEFSHLRRWGLVGGRSQGTCLGREHSYPQTRIYSLLPVCSGRNMCLLPNPCTRSRACVSQNQVEHPESCHINLSSLRCVCRVFSPSAGKSESSAYHAVALFSNSASSCHVWTLCLSPGAGGFRWVLTLLTALSPSWSRVSSGSQ